MSDLTEFLIARIAQDEGVAQRVREDEPRWDESWEDEYPSDSAFPAVRMIGRFSADRVLAECEAKRRIVEIVAAEDDGTAHPRALVLGDDVLLMLALPYADHPDYREEWRP